MWNCRVNWINLEAHLLTGKIFTKYRSGAKVDEKTENMVWSHLSRIKFLNSEKVWENISNISKNIQLFLHWYCYMLFIFLSFAHFSFALVFPVTQWIFISFCCSTSEPSSSLCGKYDCISHYRGQRLIKVLLWPWPDMGCHGRYRTWSCSWLCCSLDHNNLRNLTSWAVDDRDSNVGAFHIF